MTHLLLRKVFLDLNRKINLIKINNNLNEK